MEKKNLSQQAALDQLQKLYVPCSELFMIYHINQGNYAIVELLLQAGISANSPFVDCEGFPHFPVWAAIRKNNVAIVKLLLAHGLDLNNKLQQGKTALMLAIENDSKEIVEYLVGQGAGC